MITFFCVFILKFNLNAHQLEITHTHRAQRFLTASFHYHKFSNLLPTLFFDQYLIAKRTKSTTKGARGIGEQSNLLGELCKSD